MSILSRQKFCRQEYIAKPSSTGSPPPRGWIRISCNSCTATPAWGFFSTRATWEALVSLSRTAFPSNFAILNIGWVFLATNLKRFWRPRISTWLGATVGNVKGKILPFQNHSCWEEPPAISSCLNPPSQTTSKGKQAAALWGFPLSNLMLSPLLGPSILLLRRVRQYFQVKQGREGTVLLTVLFLLFWALQKVLGPWLELPMTQHRCEGWSQRESGTKVYSQLLLK